MTILDQARALAQALAALPEQDRVAALNDVRAILHAVSPFRAEPVDLVLWVPADSVRANAYNPNSVAPAELALLRTSIRSDGFTQPVVTFQEDGRHEVVDGFHRSRVGKEDPVVRERVRSHLPVVAINADRTCVTDRMAATIRHNRARGKHAVVKMSDIVVDLSRRGWTSDRIGAELGMDADEVLRLKQVTGLAELFQDAEFSEAWTVEAVEEEPGEKG